MSEENSEIIHKEGIEYHLKHTFWTGFYEDQIIGFFLASNRNCKIYSESLGISFYSALAQVLDNKEYQYTIISYQAGAAPHFVDKSFLEADLK